MIVAGTNVSYSISQSSIQAQQPNPAEKWQPWPRATMAAGASWLTVAPLRALYHCVVVERVTDWNCCRLPDDKDPIWVAKFIVSGLEKPLL